jgi:hypothetical protein
MEYLVKAKIEREDIEIVEEKWNIEDIANKINEIIDFLNKKGE